MDETYIAIADLVAQFSMAQSARWMIVLSIIQAVIGIVGIFALVETIKQSRRAIDVQQDIGKKQQRSYMSIVIESMKVDIKTVVIKIGLKNVGSSPATIINFIVWCEIVDPDKDTYFPLYIVKDGVWCISSGDCTYVPYVVDWSADVTARRLLSPDFDRGGLGVVVMASVTYKDIFGDVHTTAYNAVHKSASGEFVTYRYFGDNKIV